MSGGGCIGPHAVLPNAVSPDRLAEALRPGDEHRQQIGHGRAGDKEPAGAVGEIEQLAHPAHHLALNLDRSMVAPAKIGVQAACQHLRQHSSRRSAALDPPHKTGMHVAACIRQDIVHEFAVHLLQRHRFARNVGAKMLPHGRRHRCPYRAYTEIDAIVQHVVQHAVRLGAEFRPVPRIERGVIVRVIRRHNDLLQTRPGHAASIRNFPARRVNMACTALNIFCICAGL